MNRTSIRLAAATFFNKSVFATGENPGTFLMKVNNGLIHGLVFLCSGFYVLGGTGLAGQLGQITIPSPTPYSIVAQDANSRVWERTEYELAPSGQMVARKHAYNELASGLNHLVNGRWVTSSEQISILPNGIAAATNGQHQAYFPGDIYDGQITLVTPDGQQLTSRPLALCYFDGTNTAIIAELTNAIGFVMGDNRVIYPNAFTGFKVDLRYTYTKSSFEQDIILRQMPPTPESLGLNPDTARLQVMTEFFSAPQPTIRSTQLPPQAGLRLTDDRLCFGSMQMVPGRAFLLGTNAVNAGARVSKRWVSVQGRKFLIEEVPVDAILAGLAALPLTSLNDSPGKNSNTASKELRLPLLRPAKNDNATSILLAKAEPPSPGFVLDYQTVSGTFSNFTFQADTTYYVSDNLNLVGTTTIEGGTVVKYANPGPTIGINDAVSCQTSPYRPALFTSMQDDSAGEIISGSTNLPTVDHSGGCYYLFFNDISQVSLHDMRICYAYCGITIYYGSLDLRDVQFIHNDYPLFLATTPTANIFNILMQDVQESAFYSYLASINIKHLTLDQCNQLGDDIGGSTMAMTNSLLTGISSMGTISYATNYVAVLSTNLNVFQTVGGGHYYLATNSVYRDAGTTNIEAGILTDIQAKTTYPPISYTNVTFGTTTTLSPQVQRDTDIPDLGYHYDPLDYAFGGCTTSSNLTFTAGTAVGWFRSTSGWYHAGQGLQMSGNIKVLFSGTATLPTYWVRLNTVQEQDKTAGYGHGSIENWAWPPIPIVRGDFLRCSAMAGESFNGYFADDFGWLRAEMKNTEFWGGALGTYGDYMAYTNCLFQRVSVGLWNGDSSGALYLQNCTMFGGVFQVQRSSGGTTEVSVRNSAFDGTTNLLTSDFYATNATYTDYDYNAYTNSTNPFSIGGTHDQMSVAFNWQTNWLGNFYQPTNSPLINMGSTTANLLGLYHFTTQTNQLKESTSYVDIGYHYVSVDAYGDPIDTNEDGIPDYLEDANGNGSVEPGEIGWNIVNDLNLWVLITRPNNGGTLP
jgi:hypothetical protein